MTLVTLNDRVPAKVRILIYNLVQIHAFEPADLSSRLRDPKIEPPASQIDWMQTLMALLVLASLCYPLILPTIQE
jgi:hypothetical protein